MPSRLLTPELVMRIREFGWVVVLDTELRKLHREGRTSAALELVELAFAEQRDIGARRLIALAEKRAGEGECPSSPAGQHIVDTSMESGPNNCFHCEKPMPRGLQSRFAQEASDDRAR